ncbi:sensor histidine kinase [Actinopolymorpha alba]|uniref:sensor histidine kinase n=1 Tax=Actinopolymorpha alba TaxID=533267 RepID=UPI0005903CB3|nr:sensor histidine kinase [Actinopolymorpha alba]
MTIDSRRAYAQDGLIAVGVAGLLLLDALLAGSVSGFGVASLLFLLVASLALVVRRRSPRLLLVFTTLCVLGSSVQTPPDAIAVLPVLVALYTAVRAGHRVFAIAVVAPLIVRVLVGNAFGESSQSPAEALQAGFLPVGWFVAAAVTAEVSRQRAAYLEQVEQRAVDAERTREEVARRRAGEERLRIARELHDSLTHSISVIKVQAGVAIHLTRKRGEEVPSALLAIQEAGGDAIRELRATLEVLRDPGDAEESAGSGLARLSQLLERARSTGLPITLTVTGRERALPGNVDRTAYRVIQEALTNVSRHAGRASASVRLEYAANELVVQVDDDGQAQVDTAEVPGVGLIGMRERVTAVGGRLWAGPRADGGFRVRAELPLEGAAAEGTELASVEAAGQGAAGAEVDAPVPEGVNAVAAAGGVPDASGTAAGSREAGP